jgi:hypothetical protein
MIEETPRTEQEIRDSIAYHKKMIRHIEILFVVMSVLAVTLFSMIAWKNGIFNILSFAIAMFSAHRLWTIGTDWELSKFWDELELLKFTNKEEDEDEKIS